MLLALAKPLGWYMARVYEGQACGLDRVVGPLERLIYRLCGVRQTEEMDWKTYGIAMLLFNAMGLVAVYAIAATPRIPAAESSGVGSRHDRSCLQHRCELRDQYELAGLRRRNDAELSDSDAWTHRAEFCVRRNRDGDPGRVDQGLGATERHDHRQLLDGPHPQHPVHSPAAGPALVPAVGVTRRRSDVRVIPDRHIAPAGQLCQARDGCERPAGAG